MSSAPKRKRKTTNKLSDWGRYDPSRAGRYTVSSDNWDFRTSSAAFEESKELNAAQRRLLKNHPTGSELMRDIFHSFIKVVPQTKERGDVDPSHHVNFAIMNEITKMEDFDMLRKMSVGDPEGSSIATATLEKDIEVIFDKLKKAEELAKKIAEKMQQIKDADPTADDMIENLQKEIDDLESQLQQELDGQGDMIRDQLRDSMSDLADQAEAEEQAKSWGLDQGELTRMDHKTRIELGKKLSREEFKRMAEVIGRFQNIAMAAMEQRKVESHEEIYDVELGNSVEHMLVSEALALTDDDLFYDFVRKFTEHSLAQYALQGTETTSKGGIIFVEDGSGSMSGEPAIWSKAIGLALLKIATVQHREFKVSHFGGREQFVVFDFDTSGTELSLEFEKKTYTGFDAVMEFAQLGFNYAGTDFETPLSEAVKMLQEENDRTGATAADIIFTTDGQARVTDQWLAEYNARKEELAFRTYGFAIGTLPQSKPISDICDAVATPANLLDGTDLEALFKKL